MPEIYILSFSKEPKPYESDEVQGTPFESQEALITYLQQNPTVAKRFTPVIYKIDATQQNVDAVVERLTLHNKPVSLLNHKNVNTAVVNKDGKSLQFMLYQSRGRLEQAKKDEALARSLVEHHAKSLKPANLISLLVAHRGVWPNKKGPMKWLKLQDMKLVNLLLENWDLCPTVFQSAVLNDLSQDDLSALLNKHRPQFMNFYSFIGDKIPLLKQFMEKRAAYLAQQATEDPRALAELLTIPRKLEEKNKDELVKLILDHIQKSGSAVLNTTGLELHQWTMEVLGDPKIAIPLLKSATFVNAANSAQIAFMLNLHKNNPDLHEAVRNKKLPPNAMPSHVRRDLVAKAQGRKVDKEVREALSYFDHSSIWPLMDCERTETPEQSSRTPGPGAK